MDYMVCPLRNRQFDIKDFWTNSEKCSYCGSIKPEYFFELINEGHSVKSDKLTRTFKFTGDKQFLKFCYEQLNHEEKIKLNEMHKEKKITLISDPYGF